MARWLYAKDLLSGYEGELQNVLNKAIGSLIKDYETWIRKSLADHGIDIPENVAYGRLQEIINQHNILVEERDGFYELKVGRTTIAKRPMPYYRFNCNTHWKEEPQDGHAARWP